MSFANELHKNVNLIKEYRQVITDGIDDVWAIDLVDMGSYSGDYRYILTCVDCFSRYAWAVPMRVKTEDASLDAFKRILASGRKPTRIWTDRGTEFWNSKWNKFLKERDIGHYSTFEHVSMVERFNRTLKTRMWKYFTENSTRKWDDVLGGFVSAYNHVKHSSIGMTPIEASQKKNEEDLMKKMYPPKVEVAVPKFKLNDWVRISREKGTFEKGYTNKWSKEIFQIVRISLAKPTLYYLEDEAEEPVKGAYYENDLQLTKQEPEEVEPLRDYVKVLSYKENSKKGYDRYTLKVDFGDGAPSFEDAKSKKYFSYVMSLKGVHEVPLNKFMMPYGEKGKRIVVYIQKWLYDTLPDVWKAVS
jgi:hypothetical protein